MTARLPGPGRHRALPASRQGQVPVHHALIRRAPRKRHDQVPRRPLVQRAHRIPHLGKPGQPRPGRCRGRFPRRAGQSVTAGAGPPSVTTPPSRSGRAAARTPRLPTIWGGPPACGSPSCARAAGKPHPATRCNPSPAGHERRPGTEAPSPATGPRQPVRRLPAASVSRRERSSWQQQIADMPSSPRPHRASVPRHRHRPGPPARAPDGPRRWSPPPSPHWALVCMPALDDPAAVERYHHAARQLTQTSLHALASRAASPPRPPAARTPGSA